MENKMRVHLKHAPFRSWRAKSTALERLYLAEVEKVAHLENKVKRLEGIIEHMEGEEK